MNRRTLLLALATLMSLAATADTFSYLKLSSSGGDQTLAADGLTIVFNGGNLVATSGSATATVALSKMNYMEFTDTQSGETTLKTGDVNGDGVVDIDDVSCIINVILGINTADDFEGNCDLDGSGVVDVSDMSEVINIILGRSAAPRRATNDDTQTLWVVTGDVKWAFTTSQLGQMTFADGSTLTVLGKTFDIADIDSIYVDDSEVADDNIAVAYASDGATVTVAGNIATHITGTVSGGHATVLQDSEVASEYTYTLSGTSENGSFYTAGSYKMTLVLDGVELTNPDSAAINIRNGKRIEVQLADGTTSSLADGAGGSQKGCFAVKGHTEFKGGGTLNITGNASHAFWGKEYVELKKSVGTINVLKAAGDGFNVNQYFQMNGGTVNVSGVGDDAIQVSYETDDDGNIDTDSDNTGLITIKGGTLDLTTTGSGVKGLKTEGTVAISGGSITITQSGSVDTSGSSLSYSTGIKADGNVDITGGSITITNTAQGGKGISADGDITIDEGAATVTLDIKANGAGGTAEATGSGSGSTEPEKSYKLYVSIPASGGGMGPGGGNAWTSVYLYKSDGTLVQKLTSTVTKSTGANSTTFYYYDFKAATSDTYYFKSDNYTSRGGGWGGGSSTTYTIITTTVSGPSDGNDIYYTISNSYSSSGTTRTYSVSNVTSQWGGSSDVSEENGTGYNASGLKADGNITIGGGNITIANSGAMSKSIKSKGTVTINGGTLTLKPSGAMMVINSDASYSQGIKAVNYVMNGGSVDITASGTAGKGISTDYTTVNDGTIVINATGAGQLSGSNRYTTKGMKADYDMALNGGNIRVVTTQAGAKAIKVNGNYTQGVSGGDGPTVYLSTSGARLTNSSGSGMGMGKTTGSGGAAKGIKAAGTVTIYGGDTEVYTNADGGEGIEGKNGVTIEGGKHYLKCYDDCISSNGKVCFNDGITVAYSTGNDAVDSNYSYTGAITIKNGTILAYTTKGGAEEGLDCDNNSRIQITGTGIAISAGGSQGGGGSWGGSGNTISGAAQGYAFVTSSVTYSANRYYVLQESTSNPLVTFSFPATVSSSLSLFTAKGMVKGTTYYVKYNTTAPTDATTEFHGLYLGSKTLGTTQATSFTAQ